MKKFSFAFVVLAGLALASCNNDNRIAGEPDNKLAGEAIEFGGGFRAITRANATGAAAADLLGKEFVVFGTKGNADGSGMELVFDNYRVKWAENTAGTTASNTHDWEYVGYGLQAPSSLTGNQTIKYWDYSKALYQFAAYSVGKGNTLITTGTPTAGQILGSAIDKDNLATKAYTLQGAAADLAKCYITDVVPMPKSNFNNVVTLTFRSLATKVRMAIYETVPGYSVNNVKFYSDATTSIATGASSASAILFGDDVFYTAGDYTVYFPHINAGTDVANLAHVSMGTEKTQGDTQNFGALNYSGGFLGKTLNTASYAGDGYTIMMPNELGATLEMRVDYDLVSDDGSGEKITIHGARAFVPAEYTQWQPNYAYTYIFKISDNTNGWTSLDDTNDPEGLFPITFDAVVADSETNTQATITTVATPSITSYQKGHNPAAQDEYAVGQDIYIRLMNNGALITTLTNENSKLYTLDRLATEGEVADALNIGRNGLVLTDATINNAFTTIPRSDGNDIAIASGSAAKFTPVAGKIYAYVYLVQAGSPVNHYTAVKFDSQPADWSTEGKYVLNPDGTGTPAAFEAGKVYYMKYVDKQNKYAVKVIKVVA